MLYLTIILLIIIEGLSLYKYKDLLCPAVIHNIFWIFSICGFAFLAPSYDLSLKAFFTIIMGAIVFQIGYSLPHKRKLVPVLITGVNANFIKLSIWFVTIPFLVVLYLFIKSGLLVSASLYNSLKDGNEELGIPALFSYVFMFIQFFTIAILSIYWSVSKSINDRSLRIHVFFLLLVGLASALAVPTRNGMLFFLAPLIMVYLYTHHFSTKRIVFLLVTGLSIFLLYFYFVSLGKYWYMYETESTDTVIKEELLSYLSNSIYAFDVSIDAHEYTRMGKDTFRFFIAIWDSIFGTNYTPPLVNDFVGKQFDTNVYTFYDYYLRDFGIIYAVFIQFFLSRIHGSLYMKSKKGYLPSIYFSALLSYPLIMQFFQDQYFSLLSLWLQAIIVALIVFGSHLFVKYKRINN